MIYRTSTLFFAFSILSGCESTAPINYISTNERCPHKNNTTVSDMKNDNTNSCLVKTGRLIGKTANGVSIDVAETLNNPVGYSKQ